MATIDLGKIKLVNRGAYNNSTAYTVDDLVQSGGSTYICIQNSTGNAVTNGSYWNVLAEGGDVASTLTTQGDVLYRDGSGLQRLAKPASNKFLRNTSAGAVSWETVTSKLLGHKITQYHEALNLGNRNQTDTGIVTGLTTTYGAPVSNNSYFVARAHIHGSHDDNHMRGYLEYSVDGGSNWVADGWTTGTQSGASINWSSDDKYEYPHMSWEYNTDDNRQSTASCAVLYQPSVPHSISDFRVRVVIFCNDSTTNCMINRTTTQTSQHGNTLLSSLEVIEYST